MSSICDYDGGPFSARDRDVASSGHALMVIAADTLKLLSSQLLRGRCALRVLVCVFVCGCGYAFCMCTVYVLCVCVFMHVWVCICVLCNGGEGVGVASVHVCVSVCICFVMTSISNHVGSELFIVKSCITQCYYLTIKHFLKGNLVMLFVLVWRSCTIGSNSTHFLKALTYCLFKC